MDAQWIESQTAGLKSKMYGSYLKASGKEDSRGPTVKVNQKPIMKKKAPRKRNGKQVA